MTPLSPLQLRNHFFTLFSIRPNPDGTVGAQQIIEPTVSFEKNPQAPSQWLLNLGIVVKRAKPEAPTLYEAQIEMFGLVEVLKEFPPDKAEQLAVVNGLSLLYSATREMFQTVTARCGHGPMSLPVLSFVDVLANRADAQPPPHLQSQPEEATAKSPGFATGR
jgi:preprotein translocase subunit SecB